MVPRPSPHLSRRPHILMTETHSQGQAARAEKAEKPGPHQLRVQLGTALQKHRLRRGLTQAQLAEFADLSLKYVGEIERGEANTTLEAIERLADAIGWNPMDALDGAREPLTEGIRLLLVAEVEQMVERLKTMVRWLQALDPARHPEARLAPGAAALLPERSRKRVRSRARPSKRRKDKAGKAKEAKGREGKTRTSS